MMKSSLVKKAFNQAADQYDASCALQLNTGLTLIDLLKNYCTNSTNILDAGCGTGILTKEIAATFQYKILYAIDIADQLLVHAEKKLKNSNIHIELADYNDMYDMDVLFDMIYANLSLHWSDNFGKTLASMHNKLNENGMLGFSIPLLGTFKEIKNDCSINTFNELPQIERHTLDAGFHIIYMKAQEIIFDFDNALKALKSIKSVGANYVDTKSRNVSFKKMKKFIQSNNNSFRLSYNIGYFIVKK
jgi:malonyl-CoA O-methyltransferase